jgi:hypothetical protein
MLHAITALANPATTLRLPWSMARTPMSATWRLSIIMALFSQVMG